MTVFCPSCYAENSDASGTCSACGQTLDGAGVDDYTEKLIWALRHPEPTVAPRAAWILGERRERRAVGPLLALIRRSQDMGALEAAATALGKIGDRRAVTALEGLARRSFVPVRRAAERALEAIKASAGENR